MDADPRLVVHRQIWDEKPALQKIYADYYRRIAAHCAKGPTLEIGAGAGHIREYLDQVYMADILPAEWLDMAADAQQLPFGDASLDNIVMLDVLHHIEQPAVLFNEVARVLRPGGRIVMLDPGITIGSWPVYKFLHAEPVNMSVDPLREGESQSSGDPFDSNQAVPTLLFSNADRCKRFELKFPALKVAVRQFFGFATYPLTGGFQNWCFVPSGAVSPLLSVERCLEPVLARLLGFRLLVALERV